MPETANPRSRWYVKHKPEVTAVEAARKSVGLQNIQIKRLLRLATGELVTPEDFKLCPHGFRAFQRSVAKRVPWLRVVPTVGDKWTVNNIPRLRQFLGMEE